MDAAGSTPMRGRVVPCYGCSLAVRVLPCGSCSKPYLVCTARGGDQVTEWDGCTLGEPGEPIPAVVAREAALPDAPASAGAW